MSSVWKDNTVKGVCLFVLFFICIPQEKLLMSILVPGQLFQYCNCTEEHFANNLNVRVQIQFFILSFHHACSKQAL